MCHAMLMHCLLLCCTHSIWLTIKTNWIEKIEVVWEVTSSFFLLTCCRQTECHSYSRFMLLFRAYRWLLLSCACSVRLYFTYEFFFLFSRKSHVFSGQ